MIDKLWLAGCDRLTASCEVLTGSQRQHKLINRIPAALQEHQTMHMKSASAWGRSLLFALMIFTTNVGTVAQTTPPTIESLDWYTPDRDFTSVEPAPWVYEGVQKVFIGDFANPMTLPYVDKLAEMGVTVMHTGGPDPYFPLRRDGGTGHSPKERELLLSAFDHIRSRGIRIVIGVSPYAPAEYVKQHPEWRLKLSPDQKPLDISVYLLWADSKLENWYRKLHTRLREVNPQAAVYTWTTNAGRYGHLLTSPRVMSARMNLLFDSPVQEWWLDEVNLGSSVVAAFGAAYVRAVTGGRTGSSEPYIMSRGKPSTTRATNRG